MSLSEEDLIDKSAKNLSALQQLGMMIPGYRGYLKSEHRKEADKVQRDFLCKKLNTVRNLTEESLLEWTEEGRFSLLSQGQKLLDVFQKVESQIGNADRGLSLIHI